MPQSRAPARSFQKGELVFVCRRDEALIDSWGSPTDRAGMEEYLKKLRRTFPQFAVNHSCGPNVFSMEQSIQRNEGNDGFYFFVLRSISKGEEITKAYTGALHLGRAAVCLPRQVTRRTGPRDPSQNVHAGTACRHPADSFKGESNNAPSRSPGADF